MLGVWVLLLAGPVMCVELFVQAEPVRDCTYVMKLKLKLKLCESNL